MKRAVFAAAAVLAALAAGPSQAQGVGTNIGTIIAMGAKFCPQGWLEANGQLLPIAEYDQLFLVIGTTYGGDGANTFALPKGGPYGPAKAPIKWCIATEGQTPRAMNTPPKHK
jgi:microcystin-dependent protein